MRLRSKQNHLGVQIVDDRNHVHSAFPFHVGVSFQIDWPFGRTQIQFLLQDRLKIASGDESSIDVDAWFGP